MSSKKSSKSPGDISVVTLIRTDTTLDHSQKAETVVRTDKKRSVFPVLVSLPKVASIEARLDKAVEKFFS